MTPFFGSFFREVKKWTNNKIISFILNVLIGLYTAKKMLFLKSFGFLQGPDNMVLIKSANEFGINKVYYPFASYKFISIIATAW